jgi:hypothetical protein
MHGAAEDLSQRHTRGVPQPCTSVSGQRLLLLPDNYV